MSISELQGTGQFVSADMFGANAVFERTNSGTPTSAYVDAGRTLGVENIRFGGGQADLDPQHVNSRGEQPVDGVSAINIVDMPNGVLRTELVNFLDWCVSSNAAGQPVQTTLIIPTKHLDVAGYTAFADDISVFVQTVMQQYGDVISAFQIGNEYWEMGGTAYGQKASIAAVAIERGLEWAGIQEQIQPQILVQMASAGNSGSEFGPDSASGGFLARNQAANENIISQLSADARQAIDGVTEHYYYNRTDFLLPDDLSDTRNIDRDYDVWNAAFSKELDLYITEWNVRTSATELHGLVAASTLVHQFENMIEMGVDGAHIWALDYHSRTALTLDTDNGLRLDAQGRLLNSAPGAIFDLMSGSLVGKELLTASFNSGVPDVNVSAYASNTEATLYISSRSLDMAQVTLDLSTAGFALQGSAQGVRVSLDISSTNGRQWQNGENANGIQVNGSAYYYNEHDADVVLTDLTFARTDQIDLTLAPFEVVELTFKLGEAFSPTQVTEKFQTTEEMPMVELLPETLGAVSEDWIKFQKNLDQSYVGTDGIDTLGLTGDQSHYTLTLSADDIILSDRIAGGSGADTLISIELLEFQSGVPSAGGGLLNLDTLDGITTLTPNELAPIIELYIAYFNRAPDAVGLAFWGNSFAEGVNMQAMAAMFMDQDETRATYPDTMSNAEFLTAIYNNVLGRDPDAEGFAFWLDHLDAGRLGRDTFILDVLGGAKAVPGPDATASHIANLARDLQYLADKTDIGAYFSVHKGMSDLTDAAQAMALFDGSQGSIQDAVDAIDTYYAEALDPSTGDFLMPIVGVMDDPFAV